MLEAPYLWRDAAHMAKALGSGVLEDMNKTLVAKRGMRMLAPTYYGKRHVTTGQGGEDRRRHGGLQAARAAGRHLPGDGRGLGRQATPINFTELYLALSQGAVDGQENPLPTIQSGKLHEVQKFLILTGHIITPRLVIVNEAWLDGLADADREILEGGDRRRRQVAGRRTRRPGSEPGRHLQGRPA